jgi:N-acetylglutamate synthase/N-acetylornithine aminotransferase
MSAFAGRSSNPGRLVPAPGRAGFDRTSNSIKMAFGLGELVEAGRGARGAALRRRLKELEGKAG